MSAMARIASLMLAGLASTVILISAPPGTGLGQTPAARVPGYTAPQHFPSPLGLRPTTSGFTGINPGALPTRPYGSRPGNSIGPGMRGRGYQGLPLSYFFTPYYYPGLYDSGYGSGDYAQSSYYAGPDPVADSLAAGQGYLGHQIQQLSEQVDQLQNGQQSASSYTPPAQPQPEVPPVMLVLRGGQQLQVKSYAIMAEVFWDFTNPITKKIPLANIDMAASMKATEAKGGEFPIIGQ